MRSFLFLAAVIAVLCLFAPSVHAQDKESTEGIPFNSARLCEQNTAGFDANFNALPVPPGGFRNRIYSVSDGHSFLNEDGTEDFTFEASTINLDSPVSPVTWSHGTCHGTLTRTDDGHVFDYGCKETENKGATIVFTGAEARVLYRAKDHTTVVATPTPPVIEHVTETFPNGFVLKWDRVCIGTAVGHLKLPGER